jgi:cysteinyl-tRNA synthetase
VQNAPEGEANPEIAAMLTHYRSSFIEKMKDDFNAPAALATLQDLTRQVNTLLNEGPLHTKETLAAIDELYRQLGGQVLGIIPDKVVGGPSAEREEGLIQLLIDIRDKARADKDWATSDNIRDQLLALGIILEDRADGTIWKATG